VYNLLSQLDGAIQHIFQKDNVAAACAHLLVMKRINPKSTWTQSLARGTP
jgi:hypothetical protein